jgi:nicotinate-nucleotide adenylyltransferase
MFGKRLVPFKHRMAMCQKAASIFSRCSVLDVEKDLGGRSLMLRTIQALKSYPIYQNMEFSLVIGLDNWLVRDKWEGFDQIQQECRIIVVGKDDQPRLPDIRSTLVRNSIAAGESVINMVPDAVLAHIREYKFYGYQQ